MRHGLGIVFLLLSLARTEKGEGVLWEGGGGVSSGSVNSFLFPIITALLYYLFI